VERWQSLVGALAGLVAALAPLRSTRQRLWATALCGAGTVASALLAVHLPDASWDANLYHYPAAFALADGWNPILDAGCPVATPSALVDAVIRCYPKAPWIASAQAYAWFGTIDAGNLLHWLLMGSVVGPGLLVARYRRRSRRRTALAVALLAAANPVTLAQLASGYVDTILASLLTITVFGWLAQLQHGHGDRTLPCLGSILLVGTKFTGLVYAAALGAGVVVLLASRSRPRAGRTALVLAVTFVLGALLTVDSYAHNLRHHGNPFHPVWSTTEPDILAGQADRDFLARSRFEKLALSLVARQPDSGTPVPELRPEPRLPFARPTWTHQFDARFSGFGPLFYEALLLGALLWTGCRDARLGAFALLVLASALATDASWWARLSPQLWLLPVLALLPLRRREVARERPRWWRTLGPASLGLLLLMDVVLVGGASLRDAVRTAHRWQAAAANPPSGAVFELMLRPQLRAAMLRRLRER